MGGEWGLGSSLAMESIPPQLARDGVGHPAMRLSERVPARGDRLRPPLRQDFGDYTFGWRAMFLLSVLPAFVVLFIRAAVPESPAFEASQKHEKPQLWATVGSTRVSSSTWSS